MSKPENPKLWGKSIAASKAYPDGWEAAEKHHATLIADLFLRMEPAELCSCMVDVTYEAGLTEESLWFRVRDSLLRDKIHRPDPRFRPPPDDLDDEIPF